MTKKITKSHARALFSDLRDTLTRLNEIVEEIIETRAWLALGYKSFGEAYAAEMVHLPIKGQGLRNSMAILMAADEAFDPSVLPSECADNFPAATVISERMVKQARKELQAGIPADEIKVLTIGRSEKSEFVYRDHLARFERGEKPVFRRATRAALPTEQTMVRVQFTPPEIQRFKRIAEAKGTDIATEARKAIERRFDALEADLRVGV